MVKLPTILLVILVVFVGCDSPVSAPNSDEISNPPATPNDRPLIADHTSVQSFDDIPEYWLNRVKEMILHHTGQSHGRQIPFGLDLLEAGDPTYDVDISIADMPADTGALRVIRSQRSQYSSWYELVGPSDYWLYDEGRAETQRTLDYHSAEGTPVDVSLHTLSYYVNTWTVEDVEFYLHGMSILEDEYPDVIFVYETAMANAGDDTGYNRWLRNERIREFVKQNNKVLFDYGEMDTWSTDGTEQNTYSYDITGDEIPREHPDWGTDPYYDAGHINEEGTVMKAKAMWWLLARLAGWNGQ